jgi:hypothetical protein
MSALPKQRGQEWSPGPEEKRRDRQLSNTDSPAAAQERLIETLTIVADWKDELRKKQARMLLRMELIGVEEDEIDQLRAEFRELERCIRVLAGRPEEDGKP